MGNLFELHSRFTKQSLSDAFLVRVTEELKVLDNQSPFGLFASFADATSDCLATYEGTELHRVTLFGTSPSRRPLEAATRRAVDTISLFHPGIEAEVVSTKCVVVKPEKTHALRLKVVLHRDRTL